MNLFNQTARYLLLTACVIALMGSVGFYRLIHQKIQFDVDEMLLDQVKKTEQRLQRYPTARIYDWDDNPHIEPVSKPIPAEFSDIQLPDSLTNNQLIDVRQYQATVLANGQLYLVRFRLPYFEFYELARHLSYGVIVGFLLLMALSVIIGLALSRQLWKPFYATINQLSNFQLDGPLAPSFPQSHIREFALLNRSLSELTAKLQGQFSLQKQFTENASHELQTPLAVALSELDFLLQSLHLTEEDHSHLQRATDALSRLSQINRSLLLLTQVENGQFATDKRLNFSLLVEQYVSEFKEFFVYKELALNTVLATDVQLRIDHNLAGVLLTNLLKNAIRHSPAGTSVDILLTTDALTIRNIGKPLPFATSELFSRFVKDPTRADSIGLGLALVKQICNRYDLPLTYQYDTSTETHSFRVSLPKIDQ